MASITFAVDEELQKKIVLFSWINLSELVRQELMKEKKLREQFEEFKRIISKSKFTEKDAKMLSDKINSAMHEKLKKREI